MANMRGDQYGAAAPADFKSGGNLLAFLVTCRAAFAACLALRVFVEFLALVFTLFTCRHRNSRQFCQMFGMEIPGMRFLIRETDWESKLNVVFTSEDQKRFFLQCFVDVAMSDKTIHPKEVAFIEKLAKIFGVTPPNLLG